MPISPFLEVQLCRDAPFAWLMRDKAVASSRYTPDDISFFDSRLDGYLDFIKIAEQESQNILSSLDIDDWGSIFVHAWHALEINSEEALLNTLSSVSSDDQWRELASALSYHSRHNLIG